MTVRPAQSINMEVVKILVRSNSDLYAVDETGRNPLSLLSVKCKSRKFMENSLKVLTVTMSPVGSQIGSMFDFSRYLLSKTLSDITFVVEGQEFPAHRIVLSVVSG